MHKSLSKEEISKINNITEEPLLGICYGSKNINSDLDIFLIYKNPLEKNVFKDNFDFNQINIQNFKEKIFYRDIEYTEPILTGEYLFGIKEILNNSLIFLNENKVDKIAYEYLKKRSIETFLQAKNLYYLGKEELLARMHLANFSSQDMMKNLFENSTKFNSDIMNKSLSTLTYTLSYLASIQRYKSGDKTLTIKDMIENPRNEIENTFTNLRKYFKSCSKKENYLSFNHIDIYFKKSKDLLNSFISETNE